jgi:hypothetical protein
MIFSPARSVGALPGRRFAPALLVIGALLTAPVLAGCSGEQIQSIVGDATGGTVDVGGSTIPEDFPSEIPLASGEVATAGRVGTGTGKVWNVTITVADPAAPSIITEQLTSAGFASTSNLPGAPDIGGSAGFSDGTYAIALIVTDNGDGSYAANYTVTSVPK